MVYKDEVCGCLFLTDWRTCDVATRTSATWSTICFRRASRVASMTARTRAVCRAPATTAHLLTGENRCRTWRTSSTASSRAATRPPPRTRMPTPRNTEWPARRRRLCRRQLRPPKLPTTDRPLSEVLRCYCRGVSRRQPGSSCHSYLLLFRKSPGVWQLEARGSRAKAKCWRRWERDADASPFRLGSMWEPLDLS